MIRNYKNIHYLILFILVYSLFCCKAYSLNPDENNIPKIETITKFEGEEKIIENKTKDAEEDAKKQETESKDIKQEKTNVNDGTNEIKPATEEAIIKPGTLTIKDVNNNDVENKKLNIADKKDDKADVSNENKKKNEEKDKLVGETEFNNQQSVGNNTDTLQISPLEKIKKIDEETLKNIEKDIIQQENKQDTDSKQEEQKIKEDQEKKIINEIKEEEKKEQESQLSTENQIDKINNNDSADLVNKQKGDTDAIDDKNNNNGSVNISNDNKNDIIGKPTLENITESNIEQPTNNKTVLDGSQQKKDDKKKQPQKDDNDNINLDKLFTIFDKKKALDFDYQKIKGDNFALLENAEELKTIKQIIKEQTDPNIRKKKEKEAKIKKENEQKIQAYKDIAKPIENVLYLSSLFYISEDDWRTRINRKKITNKDKDSFLINGASIVKVNKTSIIFLLQKPNTLVDKVKKIKNSKVSYSGNYYLVDDGKNTYIAFKLFIGQKINLDTMVITG